MKPRRAVLNDAQCDTARQRNESKIQHKVEMKRKSDCAKVRYAANSGELAGKKGAC